MTLSSYEHVQKNTESQNSPLENPMLRISSEKNSPWQNLKGFQKQSFIDWPGSLVAVLFFSDCNFRCPTCHNADLAWKKSLPPLDAKEILHYLNQKKSWYDGLVLSGGEVTLQKDLAFLLQELAFLNLPIRIDSNGHNPELLAELLQNNSIQAVAIDIKGPFEKYPALTGNRWSPQQAKNTLQALFALAEKYGPKVFQFRTTKVPLLDKKDLDIVHSYLPKGFSLLEQEFISPR